VDMEGGCRWGEGSGPVTLPRNFRVIIAPSTSSFKEAMRFVMSPSVGCFRFA